MSSNIGKFQEASLTCLNCGCDAERTGPVQRYCKPCSEIKDIQRKAKWAKENPQVRTSEQRDIQIVKSQQARDRLETRGKILSNEAKRSINWPGDVDDDIVRLLRISVPFSWSFSKNAIFSMTTKHGGHVFLRKKARGVRDDLILEIKNALINQPPFFKGKVWLDILVQKPNNRGDAINVIDSVCDAVKIGIGIDDRYFSIRKLDWEVVKDNPKIFVGVGQTIEEDHFVCSYCGRLQPESKKSSHRRTCKQCQLGDEFEKR